jgi:hypothetical protein
MEALLSLWSYGGILPRQNPRALMERRRECRHAVELPGSYRSRGLPSRFVFFSKLSANGCQLLDCDSPLVPGDSIQLSLGQIETAAATVKWIHDPIVGVQFDTPLDDFLIDFFAAYISKAA